MKSNGLDRNARLYREMLRIRLVETRLLELFDEGELAGTTHTSIGQEANAVAAVQPLRDGDIIVSNHRCHGHYIARTGDVTGLLAELMGRAGGVSGGRGGSQHIHRENFYTNGVQGNLAPAACGMAWTEAKRQRDHVTLLFVGDGTFGEGVLYETMNLASLWDVPLLIVVENNRYAQTTPLELNFAGSFTARGRAFGIESGEIESTDVLELEERLDRRVARVRETGRPGLEVIHTYRLAPHSKGDDFRDGEEMERQRRLDPLLVHGARLDPELRAALEAELRSELEDCERRVRAMPRAESLHGVAAGELHR